MITKEKFSNEKDYLIALERFEEIFQAKPGSPESDEADHLSILIKEYEMNKPTAEEFLDNHRWSSKETISDFGYNLTKQQLIQLLEEHAQNEVEVMAKQIKKLEEQLKAADELIDTVDKGSRVQVFRALQKYQSLIKDDQDEKCNCEMPAKVKGKKMCFRCKKYLD